KNRETKEKNKMNTKRIIGLVGLAFLGTLAVLAVLNLQLETCNLHLLFSGGLALAAAPVVITEEQMREFQGILGELQSGWGELKNLPATFKSLQDENAEMKQHVTDVRRILATRHALAAPKSHGGGSPLAGYHGRVSDDCARHMAASFIAHCERSGKLEA